MNWQKIQKITLVTFLAVIVGSFALFQVLGYEIDSENLRQYIHNFGVWAPLIFILIYTLGTLFVPSTPFMIAAGILFGFKYGLAYAIVGGLLSSVIVFAASRKLGKRWVEKILEYEHMIHIKNYNERLERGAVWDIMLLRITPIMPFNILNVLMGLSKTKIEEYLVGTLVGIIPSHVLTVYLGNIILKIF